MRQNILRSTLAIAVSLIFITLPTVASSFDLNADECSNKPGDANNNGAVGILDVTFILCYIYKGGGVPPCMPEADPNGNGAINVLDVSYLINYMYRGGPAPICGPDPWPEG